MKFHSKYLDAAVESFSSLPGIGKKTALRLVLFLYDHPEEKVDRFSQSIVEMRKKLKSCSICNHLSDEELCHICQDKRRDGSTICVVESIRDIMAIEETSQYNGIYHVLGGVISPIDGVSPDDLHIDSLLERAQKPDVKELIMAVSPTIEGETTIFYLSRLCEREGLRISTISRGVAFGGELEYADEITLGRSIISRVPYQVGAGIKSDS